MNPEMAPAQELTIDETVKKIHSALADQRWDFRTVEGIARDTGLPESEVQKHLEANPSLFRQSYLNDDQGRKLYTLREKPDTVRERVAEIRGFLAAPLTYHHRQ